MNGTIQTNMDVDSTDAGHRRHGNAPRPKLPNFKKRETQSMQTWIGSKPLRKIRDGRRVSGH